MKFLFKKSKVLLGSTAVLVLCAASAPVQSSRLDDNSNLTQSKKFYTPEDQLQEALRHQKSGKEMDDVLSQQWAAFFTQGIKRVEEVIKKDKSLDESQAAELSWALGRISQKGDRLFKENEMDTYYYMFLHFLMAEIISETQKNIPGIIDNSIFYLVGEIPFGKGLKTVQTHFNNRMDNFVEGQSLRHNHLAEVREYLTKFAHQRGKDVPSLKIEDKEYTYGYLERGTAHLTMDCLFLPILGNAEEVELSFESLNTGMVHRICFICIPTEPTGYDLTPKAAARAFANRDLLHGLVFTYQGGKRMTHWSPKDDPLVKPLYKLYKKIDNQNNETVKTNANIAFFEAVHEGGYDPLNLAFSYTTSGGEERWKELADAVKSHKPELMEHELLPMDTAENFYEAYLKSFSPSRSYPGWKIEWDNWGVNKEDGTLYLTLTTASAKAFEESSFYSHSPDYIKKSRIFKPYFSDKYERTKRGQWLRYLALQHAKVMPEHLKTEKGEYHPYETFPANKVVDYYNDVLFQILLDIQE